MSGEHKIATLCRVLNVNRSTYYKYINHKESKREQENKYIRSCILELYAKSNKRLGADKIKTCLKRDYRINISAGRVYRLMKPMNLPKMRLFFMICVNTENGIKYRMVIGLVSRKAAYCP